jgi:ABC-type Fe3+-hydroxamate transport system substrate-binding protein
VFTRPSIRRLGLAGALLLLSAAAACGGERAPTGALVVVDDAGDTVRLAAVPRRVVSLIPATTELLFAMGQGDRLVGRSQWCDYPAEAARIASLGDGITPNLEAVLGARPDLVVLYHSGQNGAAAERLRSLGIPAIRVRTDLLADVPRLAALLGRLLDARPAADSLSRRFEAELAAATVPPPADPPSIFLLVWDQPPMTVGSGSYLSELVQRAGGRNIYADLPTSSGQISVESAAARDPDAILTSNPALPAFAGRPEWQVVRAVRERRFVHAPGSEYSRPGPRAPEAIRRLAAQLAALPR